MGCQACRQSEPETTFLFNDGEIKNLDNQIQEKRMTIIILFSNLQINYQI